MWRVKRKIKRAYRRAVAAVYPSLQMDMYVWPGCDLRHGEVLGDLSLREENFRVWLNGNRVQWVSMPLWQVMYYSLKFRLLGYCVYPPTE